MRTFSNIISEGECCWCTGPSASGLDLKLARVPDRYKMGCLR